MTTDPNSIPQAALEAVDKLHADYEERRREKSRAVFGHTGAHMASVPPPTSADMIAAALDALMVGEVIVGYGAVPGQALEEGVAVELEEVKEKMLRGH